MFDRLLRGPVFCIYQKEINDHYYMTHDNNFTNVFDLQAKNVEENIVFH